MMVEAKLDSKALFWGALQHLYATIIPFIKCIHNTVNSHSSVYLQLVQFNVDFQLVNQLFFLFAGPICDSKHPDTGVKVGRFLTA